MPIYEYKCANCGKQLEVMQKISEEPLKTCPECNEEKLEKQLSLSGFQFKGSGWYISDYTNRGKEAKTEASGETKPAQTETSGETKTSATAESTATAPAASKTETKTTKSE